MLNQDPRVQRSRDAVLSSALDVIEEGGLGQVTIDEVARRSGVAKTTIYRHWPTRAALVIDTCARLTTPQAIPATGSFEGDARELLTGLAHILNGERWPSVMPSVIDAAEHDADFGAVQAGIQMSQMKPFRTIVERAVKSGDLRPGTDVSAVISALVGPLYYRRWFSREPINASFVRVVVRSASTGVF